MPPTTARQHKNNHCGWRPHISMYVKWTYILVQAM